ncbi:MAG: hypothetical protein RIR49_2 [Actinomycetota bacterium]|jgi:uncharacterized membrane protein YhaH (DUF805 family)
MQLITYWQRAVLKNYVNFNGRDNRPEFWWFALSSFIVSVILGNILQITPLANLWSLAMLLPSLGAATRRLHDTGRSGWWQLIGLTIIGLIPLIIWLATEGKSEANQYGAPRVGGSMAGSGGGMADPPLPPPPPPMPQ